MGKEMKVDFGNKKDGADWYVINDGVMGGLSDSDAMLEKNSMRFQGAVSLENNGGFASMRGPWGDYDLSAYETVEIRIKGKGQTLAFTLALYEEWYRPNFKLDIVKTTEDWEVVELKLSDFQAYQVGRPTGQFMGAEQKAEVIRMGFITNEKKAGPFDFEIDYIHFK